MKIIIHGGFFSESSTSQETKVAKQNALLRIVKDSYEFLKTHSALETVVYAVSLLEDDELFNAGIGSQIQSDGKIRMSASLMDGSTHKMSGVINIEEVKNPIQVARILQDYDDKVLGGSGATNFARKHGFEVFSTEIPQRRTEYEAKVKATGTGTVGCVALDGEYGQSDICIGVPVVLGKGGWEKIIDLKLTADEKEKFEASAAAVHKTNSVLKEIKAI